jgi:TRAP-type C4-dicarboxylate transport system substrate-binding protein
MGPSPTFVSSADAQQITIRFNHTFGPETNADQAVKRFAEEVGEKSGNRVQVKVFSSGELAEERDQYNLLHTGAIEMALAGLLVGTVTPEYGIIDMLYLWRDQDHLRKFYEGSIGQEIEAKVLQLKG